MPWWAWLLAGLAVGVAITWTTIMLIAYRVFFRIW